MKISIFFICTSLSFFSLSQHSENEIIEASQKRTFSSYEVIVAPNPSPNKVVVSAPEGAICVVHSSSGNYVGTWEIRGDGLQLEDLGAGIFIAHVTYSGESFTKRFVIL